MALRYTAIKIFQCSVGWKPVLNMWFALMWGLGEGSVQASVCSAFLIGLKVTRMDTTPTNSCSLLIQLAAFNLVPGRCMGHEAPRARQKWIAFPHPKAACESQYSAAVYSKCPTGRNKEEVSDCSQRFLRPETFSSSSQLWLWIQQSEEAKLYLAIQSISSAFKCLTQFCTWRNNWSQKVWDEFRAGTYPGYISVKKGFGLKRKRSLPGTKEVQGNACHNSGLDIKVWIRMEKGM